jgi:hypothetical protein
VRCLGYHEDIFTTITISAGVPNISITNVIAPTQVTDYTPFSIQYTVNNTGATRKLWGVLFNPESNRPMKWTYWEQSVTTSKTITINFPDGISYPLNTIIEVGVK